MRIKGFMLAVLAACPAHAEEDAHKHAHGGQVFHMLRLEAGTGMDVHGGSAQTWHLNGWLGTDEHKLWLKSEGKRRESDWEQAEVWALYSRNVADFWDVQIGLRQDAEPLRRTSLAAGVEGLAPYFFETEAHVFLSDKGEASLRLRQETDLLLTQRWILQPFVEAEAFARDLPERHTGAGLAHVETGLQLRYELTPRLAFYGEAEYGRKFGETSLRAREHGEDVEETTGLLGIRMLF